MEFLLSRWVTTLLGTALLGGLVWWFGPLLPELEGWLPRVVVIQAMLVVWAVANALIDARRRARDAALTAGLSAAAPGEEAAAVTGTLTAAMAALKTSGRQKSLADLPWYAIIGPPGAGKTTALMNAGLTFTLQEQIGRASVSGVGGTRMCEWWFTERAVLIDTAGRYTTQDSDAAVDRAGWAAFLALLKRTRPRAPLNGVIVAIGVTDVAEASTAERDAHAAAIRARIAELQSRLGVRLPVYALFTKADLVAGFMEFFDGLDQAGRSQVWGETFPFDKPPAFAEGFRELVRRLETMMVPRLQAEHRADKRGPIAGFPTQVASLEKPLAAFVAAAFPPSSTMLRGVYFGSGTQEGTPIDRLTGAMARAFGIDQSRAATLRPESGRSYFIGRMLRDVVLGEAMLVREAPGVARRRVALRVAGFAAVLLAAAGAAAALVTTSMDGGRQVDAVAASLAGYEQAANGVALDPVSDGDLRPVVALLDQAQALGAAVPREPIGFGMGQFGMGQAGKLESGARQVYRDGLTFGLLPRLVWRLETQIRGSLARPDALYELTRVYLMLGGAGPLNPAQVRAWLTRDAQEAYPAVDDEGFRTRLLEHLDRLLEQPLPAVTLDTALVAAARAGFSHVPLADRVYASIRSSAKAAALPVWRPADVLGLAGMQVFTRASGRPMTDGIPGLYSAVGFKTVLLPSVETAAKQVAGEAWVAGGKPDFGPAALGELTGAVGALYAADFNAQWDAMLADLEIAPVTTVGQAAQSLYILASPESPLRAVLKSASAQVAVSAHLKPLVDLGTGDGAGLERSLRLVADIQQQLAKIAALPVGTAAPSGGEDIGAAVLADAVRQPQPLGRWLVAIAANAQALRTGNAKKQVAITYNAAGGPGPACAAAVTRYPFAPGGTPLPLAEFGRVFGPGGLLDGFFNTQLKPFVDVSSKPWKPQPGAPLGPADVAQFQRAAAIREAFFASGQTAPSLAVEVAPGSPPPPRPVVLEIGATSIEAGRGAPHATQVTWPPPDPNATASLTADPATPLLEAGPWGLFRLFARGRLQAGAKPGEQMLTFAGGTPVAFIVRTGAANPFAAGLLTEFRCPAVQ